MRVWQFRARQLEKKARRNETMTKNDEWKELFLVQTNTVIVGKKGSGKTLLGWVLGRNINEFGGRKLYVYNYPRPEILKKLPFEVGNVPNIESLYNLTDAVVIIDESHEVFNVLEKIIKTI